MSDTSWRLIKPNQHGDWINQRDSSFYKYPAIGNKKTPSGSEIFSKYSSGLKTNRDPWCYNFSKKSLEDNVRRSIEFFNGEVDRYQKSTFVGTVNDFIKFDSKLLSWEERQRKLVVQGKKISFSNERIYTSAYRPFTKCHCYFDRSYNSRVYQLPIFFPTNESRNVVICVSGGGATNQSALMVDSLPDLEIVSKSQCFPLYRYELPDTKKQFVDLSISNLDSRRVSNVSDAALNHFRRCYPSHKIDSETLFYYVYGILHSPDYRDRFKANLQKQLPRIPVVPNADDFLQFSAIGRRLGALHVNYEKLDEYPVIEQHSLAINPTRTNDEPYRVAKMKFDKRPDGQLDLSTIVYNSQIKLSGIPSETYEYTVNGKSALEWVMDRQCVKMDKPSGIPNDANQYAIETIADTTYPLRLVKQIITLSLETARLISQLPPLKTA